MHIWSPMTFCWLHVACKFYPEGKKITIRCSKSLLLMSDNPIFCGTFHNKLPDTIAKWTSFCFLSTLVAEFNWFEASFDANNWWPSCPCNEVRLVPLFTSQILMVLSSLPDANNVPSGEKHTLHTDEVCPCNEVRRVPLFTMIFLLKIRPKKCRENGVIGFLLALALDIS